MYKIGFDNEKYFDLQKKKILERIERFDNKLYMEFGGKLFDDFHASRVLPGFHPDNKIKLMYQLRDKIEIIVVINATDIENNKIRSDNSLSYDQEALRLIDIFREIGLYVGSVVITQFNGQKASVDFKEYLQSLKVPVYLHYTIDGYPSNVPLILSPEGFGKNDFIKTSHPLIMVTAPGSGSGKMAVCLSQLYQDAVKGLKSGYAKFETFPVWDLHLDHPVNLAYESATADLNDVNIIDPYHYNAYNEVATSYNRDSDVFPVLKSVFNNIYDQSPYQSPTDMGVNVIGQCIIDEEAVISASNDEIIRRYLKSVVDNRKDKAPIETVNKIEMLMNQSNITVSDRKVFGLANNLAEETQKPAVAMELPDGRIVTGKTSSLLGAASACLLNALKTIANIDDSIHLISEKVIMPVQQLKVKTLGNNSPLLHIDEVLIILAMAATEDPTAKKALEQVPKLANSEMHSSVILSSTDRNVIKSLLINLTTNPSYQTQKLFRKS